MRNDNTNNVQVGGTTSFSLGTMGFITWLVFLILKLTINPDWLTWFWVWFPLWIPIAFSFAVLLIIFVVVLIITLVSER